MTCQVALNTYWHDRAHKIQSEFESLNDQPESTTVTKDDPNEIMFD